MELISFPPLEKLFLSITISHVRGNIDYMTTTNLLPIHHVHGYFSHFFFFETNLSANIGRTFSKNLHVLDFAELLKQRVQIVFSETLWKIMHHKSHIIHSMAAVYLRLALDLYRPFGCFLLVKCYHSFAGELIFVQFKVDMENLAKPGKEVVDLVSGCL